MPLNRYNRGTTSIKEERETYLKLEHRRAQLFSWHSRDRENRVGARTILARMEELAVHIRNSEAHCAEQASTGVSNHSAHCGLRSKRAQTAFTKTRSYEPDCLYSGELVINHKGDIAMKWIGTIIQMLAVAIVVGAVVFWFARGGDGSTTTVNVDQMKKIAQLATVEYHLAVTRYHEKPPVGLEWLPAKLFVTVRGHIKGSVDMKLADIQIQKNEKIVKIFFPKASVIVSNPEIGAKDVNFMTCADPNLLHPLKDQDFTAAQKEAIDSMVQAANDDGIRVKTASEAKVVLGNFLSALGFTAEITFEDKTLDAAVPQEHARVALAI